MKKIILLLMFIVFASSVYAVIGPTGTSCSNNSADYIYYNTSINNIQVQTDTTDCTNCTFNLVATGNWADYAQIALPDNTYIGGAIGLNNNFVNFWTVYDGSWKSSTIGKTASINYTVYFNNGTGKLEFIARSGASLYVINTSRHNTLSGFYQALGGGSFGTGEVYIWSGRNCPISQPPVSSPINITSTSPNPGTYNNATRDISVLYDASENTTIYLYINGTLNATTTNPVGQNIDANFSVTFDTDGYYNYHFNVSGTTNSSVTSPVTFGIDTTFPNINTDIGANNTIVFDILSFQVNFTDNIKLFGFNISTPEGYNYSQLNINTTFYSYNATINVSTYSPGLHNVTEWTCDAHTKEEIPNYDYSIGFFDKEVKFKFGGTIFNKKDLSIKPKNPSHFNDVILTKKKDRYEDEWIKKEEYKGKEETFIVESTNKIYIIGDETYQGWLVVPGLQKWRDFNTDEKHKATIKRISDYIVEVTTAGSVFHSTGDLNCYSATQEYYSHTRNIIFEPLQIIQGVEQTITLSINRTGLPLSIVSANLVYNNTIYNVTTSNSTQELNFTATFTTPTTDKNVSSFAFFFNYSLDGFYFNTTTNTQTGYKQLLVDCGGISNTTTLNVSYLHIDTLTPIFIDSIVAINGTTFYSHSKTNITGFKICIYPPFTTLNEYATIQYGNSSGYNYYNVNLTLTNATTYLTLYWIPGTYSTTFTLIDAYSKEVVQDVFVKMFKFIGGSWTLIESKFTDITGRTKFNYEVDTAYQFQISKTGYYNNTFLLNPILFNSYDIAITPTTAIDVYMDWDKINLNYVPKVYYPGWNKFNFTISSPYAELSAYEYILTYPGGTSTRSGTNANGETLNTSFQIVNPTSVDQVKVYYRYVLNGYDRNFTFYYPIIYNASNSTLSAQKGNTYGLGIMERILIIVLIGIFIVGIATLVGKPVPGVIITFFAWSYFAYQGFIPIWAVIISMLVGVILISLRGD